MLSDCTTDVEEYDVIVVGAGPAGLMCAVWLALRGAKVKILEKKHARPLRGRADGLEPRTLEILKGFDLLDSWWRKANRTVELSVWVSILSSSAPGSSVDVHPGLLP
jgi:phenol 2-monooxygenase